jgi:molybdopterin-guanine dinucleotide biosynthesis protein A
VRALELHPGAGAAAAVAPDGRRQPFPSAWRTSPGSSIGALLAAGERRADAAFGTTVVVDVELPGDVLGDVDRPGDLPPHP